MVAERKDIHDFAVKYHSLYVNPQTTEREVEDGFADQCFAFGFEMDCGNRFIEAFSDGAFYKNEDLSKVIDDINDIALLGSAIFSHWRYVTHWADHSSLLDNEHRPWFITAFGRLAVITEEPETNTFLFEGTLQTIQLTSNNICYGPCPEPEDDLFVFDGNPDVVTRIEIKYYRNTRIKPGVVPDGAAWEYVTWDYNELLIIDRDSETLEHIREIGSGCKVTNIYYVQEGITSFLDDINVDAFSEIEGNPPDVVEDPLESKDYTITVFTKHGDARIVTGTFDKKGLPEDWPDFINDVYEFMAFYGLGELFDERVYGKAKRRQSDFIFCNVEFEDGGRTYCYLADSDDFREGDLVVVPAGPENHEAVVRIASIEYHPAESAPFPVEKTKHILRKYEENAG